MQSATSTEVVALARQGAGGASFALMALAATTGKQLWSTPLPNGFTGSPSLASGDNLYVPILHLDSGDGVVETLRATDGKQVWSHAVAEGGPTVLRLLGSALFFATLPGAGSQAGPPQAMVEALSSADGSVLWKISVGDTEANALVVVPRG